MQQSSKQPSFKWYKHFKFRYIGKSNAFLDDGKLYTGDFLVFKQATICVLGGKGYQTLTENWETPGGNEIGPMATN